MTQSLPLIDVSALLGRGGDMTRCANEIDRACRESGFFRMTGHGVSAELFSRMDELAREFFFLPESQKALVAMPLAGSAWRGWFPVGGELTSGVPDRKEGLYVGEESPLSGVPLHGPNLFPDFVPDLGPTVLEWFAQMRELGMALMRGVAMGLGMDSLWFENTIAKDPTCLFRIFHYPPTTGAAGEWGVAEHTDYGLLTILAQDDCGGLQVRMPNGLWIDVPAEPNVFVVNLGDMLDRLTEGRYRSTPHRVRNVSGRERLSFPFFMDPSWDAQVTALPLAGSPVADDAARRWDGTSVQAWTGNYGEYLTAKVSRVFPDLFSSLG